MSINFDEPINRKNTNSLKHDSAEKYGFSHGAVPMWVADMDFKAPQQVIEDVEKIASHGIYGYSEADDSYFDAVNSWFVREHSYSFRREWLVRTPGVVFALAAAVRAFTEENDSVMIQCPVYYHFIEVINDCRRKLISSSLTEKDGCWSADFDDFEKKIKENNVKLFILCSPHNPLGKVWTRDELKRMGEICLRHGCIVVSDEIHCDLVLPGSTHSVFSSVSEDFEQNSIICTSPSKTFNLAGLQISNIFIPNSRLRAQFREEIKKTGYDLMNIFGIAACVSAYNHGSSWLNSLKEYLVSNLEMIREYTADIPGIRLTEPQATYLAWLDFRELGFSKEELNAFLRDEANIWLEKGTVFGEEGRGFARLNYACTKKTLEEALIRLRRAAMKI